MRPVLRSFEELGSSGIVPTPVAAPARKLKSSAPRKVKIVTVKRHGKVKQFNPEKRFGFVTLTDEEPAVDALVHVSVLQKFGVEQVARDTLVICSVEQAEKGLVVKTIYELIPPEYAQQAAAGEYMPAKVKWFNESKGYGFVTLDADKPDVFVHAVVVKEGGIQSMPPGAAVEIMLEQTARGPKVCAIKMATPPVAE